MSIDDLGSLGEFIGSIAVIVTLVYLAFQLKQNTRQLKAQSRFNVLEGMNLDSDRLFSSERYDFVIETLSHDRIPDEHLGRLRLIINSWLSHHEIAYFDIKDGSLSRPFEQPLTYRLFTVFEMHDEVEKLWDTDLRFYYTEEFQNFVDNLLREGLREKYTPSVYRQIGAKQQVQPTAASSAE